MTRRSLRLEIQGFKDELDIIYKEKSVFIHGRRYGLDRDGNMTEPPTRFKDDESDPEPDDPSTYQNYSPAGQAIMKENIGYNLSECTKSSIWFCDQTHYILCEKTLILNSSIKKVKKHHESNIIAPLLVQPILSPISNFFTSFL